MVRYRGFEPRAARVSDEYSIPTELIAHICHKEGPAQREDGFLMTMWHPEEDSNPHLAVLETGVLAIKLPGHGRECGIRTHGAYRPTVFKTAALSQARPTLHMAVRTGVEPVTPG